MAGHWYRTYKETDGTEYVDRLLEKGLVDKNEATRLKQEILDVKTSVSRLKCERCGRELLSVFDKFNENKWWGYLGNQARKPTAYVYSPVLNVMRKLDGCEGFVWSDNPLYNVHARIHTKPVKDYSLICRPGSLCMLCNDCFQKTYNRVKVYPRDNCQPFPKNVEWIEISVVLDMHETVESVLKDLGLPLDQVRW